MDRSTRATKDLTSGVKGISDSELGIGIWEGKAVFQTDPQPSRTKPAAPTTPPRYDHSPIPSGSVTSPISISSTSPTPTADLSRPRAVPKYSSPLPRTAYTPTHLLPVVSSEASESPSQAASGSRPIHPFFSRARTAPAPSQPRFVAHYSSTEASQSQSSRRSSSSASSSQASRRSWREEVDLLAEEVGKLEMGARSGYRKPLVPPSTLPVKPKAVASRPTTKHSSPPTLTFHYGSYPCPPKVAYTSDPEEANDLLACLRGPVLGFDLEWPPAGTYDVPIPGGGTRRKKVGMTWNESLRKWDFGQGRVALMQFCDERLVVLVHLGETTDIPQKAVELLRDPSIYKLGVQVRGDGQKLLRDFPQHFATPASASSSSSSASASPSPSGPSGLLELSFMARAVDPVATGPGAGLISLANLTKAYTGRVLPKPMDVRKGNWFEPLDQPAKDYAANDVYAALMVYKKLEAMAKKHEFALDLNKYCSQVGSHVLTPVQHAKGAEDRAAGDSSGARIQIGDKVVNLAEGVRPPPPASLSALHEFVQGTDIDRLVELRGVRRTTIERYICQAISVVGLDAMDQVHKERLWNQVPIGSPTWKYHSAVGKALQEELTPEEEQPDTESSEEVEEIEEGSAQSS
ncbi:hypothetical protein IAU60_002345 [Kwoniella sp. DSM 27419]